MNKPSLPPDHQLLPLATGEPLTAEVEAILSDSEEVRLRAQQIAKEIDNLRQVAANLSPQSALFSATQETGHSHTVETERPPEKIGKYSIVGQLSQGGQATVYRALHPTLEKDVVIKLSHRHADENRIDKDRIVREGRLLAQYDFPRIAKIYDLDFYGGRPYLVMEYLRGQTLSQYHRQHPLSPYEAARLVAQVARVLAPAHASGVVHQDLKPQNIIIDHQGVPHLVDFGMAWLANTLADDSTTNQRIGGTLAYMAPEQARGETQQIGPATDIFSLGAVLYELLTGSSLYRTENETQQLEQARNAEVDRSALEHAGVDSRLAAVCTDALAETPQQRPGSVELFASRLEKSSRKRYRVPLSLTAAALVVLIICLAIPGGLFHKLLSKKEDTPPSPGDSQTAPEFETDFPEIRVQRGSQIFPLALASPARSGDQWQISCSLPSDLKATLFWFDSKGTLHELEAERIESTPHRHTINYPADEQTVSLDDCPGVELILLCAQPLTPPSKLEVEQILQRIVQGSPLPPLPDNLLIHFDKSHFESVIARSDEFPRGFEPPQASQTTECMVSLNQLHKELADQFPFIAGIAVHHLP